MANGGGRPNGTSISSAAAVDGQGPHGRQQADDWPICGMGPVGAVEVQGVGVARMEWPKRSPQGWMLLILDLLSLSHPSIPFCPRRTLCRFRRGNTLYCGFCIHYYWAHPLTLCASFMPVLPNIQYLCQWHSNTEFTSR
jgi:hypothetical protein